MSRLSYLAVLLFIVMGSGWLEVLLRTRVYRRWRRLLLALVPGFVLFCLWDAYAITRGHWHFDESRVTGITLGLLPLDEILFFLIVPIAGVLTLEAVRSVKRWECGDELPDQVRDGVRDGVREAGES